MYDNFIMIAVGLVLILASLLAKGFAYGMAPHRRKPKYAVTRRVRFILFFFGLLSFALGLLGALRK
jgi:hypothetical protein